MNVGTAHIKVETDHASVVRTARTIAKHLTAMADELELQSRQDEDESDGTA